MRISAFILLMLVIFVVGCQKVEHSFSPFRQGDLGDAWKIAFGNWEVSDGKLCHVRPEQIPAKVDKVVGGSPETALMKRVGSVTYDFQGGGVDRVRFSLNVSLGVSDSLDIVLDEWAVSWLPEYGMKALLSNSHVGSPGHDYDDEVLSPREPREVNAIEVVGEPNKVTFYLNGRELFSANRSFARPFRQIEIRTRSGGQFSDIVIETEGPHRRRVPAKRTTKGILAACVDFTDDLLYSPFTEEMIELLVERMHQIGIQRVYWQHSHRIRGEALGPNADPELSKSLTQTTARPGSKRYNYLETIKNCYPFLPKVCQAAHARGMEVYSIHKAFDLGRRFSRGVPSGFATRHFSNNHPEAKLARRGDCRNSASADAAVRTIKLYKDNELEHNLTADNLSVWVSDDNRSYNCLENVRISMGLESKSFARHWEGGQTEPREVQVITIEGLDIRAKYFAVAVAETGKFSFRNRIYRLAEILDEQGRQIPFTRNVPGRPNAKGQAWDGKGRFVFEGLTGSASPTGQWYANDYITLFHAVDGGDVGIAFQRGNIEYMPVTPNPLDPETQRFWTDWIQESLDAGVDGIDIRVVNHGNILDWANYGFGPLVEEAFKRRYGKELKADISCRREHMELLGDGYTEFLRKVSKMTHDRGAVFVHHVSQSMDSSPEEISMLNIRWDWRRWMEEGIVDGITMKNIVPGRVFPDEIMDVAEANGIETMACPYLNLVFAMSDTWDKQLAEVLKNVSDMGIDGLILYETASFLQATTEGDIVLKFPELPKVLKGSTDSK